MRDGVIWLVAATVAGCAVPPAPAVAPHVQGGPAVEAVAVHDPADTVRQRYISRARAEMRQSEPRDVPEIVRVAAEAIVADLPSGPQPPAGHPRTPAERSAAAAWEAAVRREEAIVSATLRGALIAERNAAVHAERQAREDRYCRELAEDVTIAAAPTSDLIARTLVGPTSRERRLYGSCMASFQRVRRFME